ncbi:MAG TPA: HAD family hydrolase, partial [Oculatellaceae cyanobacterium]
RKPEPEIFYRALQKLRVTAEQSVFVGDHPTTDVLGAKNIGMKTVWFRDGYWTEPVDGNAMIEDLAMLPLIIQQFE